MEIVHQPVLTKEIISFLDCADSRGTILDATFGQGGHSLAILKYCPELNVIGLDWDKDLIEQAKSLFLKQYPLRLFLYHENYANLDKLFTKLKLKTVEAIILDLGISSYHLEKSGRGFSFKRNERLDMRFNSLASKNAYDLINKGSEAELFKIFSDYGEEKRAKKIASLIVNERAKKEIFSTAELVKIIKRIPLSRKRLHPATQVFQALRIAVNNELDNLKMLLRQAPQFLSPQGKILVISYHSLEDRLVKWALKESSELKILTKKVIRSSKEETRENPRARSAKLRVAQRRE